MIGLLRMFDDEVGNVYDKDKPNGDENETGDDTNESSIFCFWSHELLTLFFLLLMVFSKMNVCCRL